MDPIEKLIASRFEFHCFRCDKRQILKESDRYLEGRRKPYQWYVNGSLDLAKPDSLLAHFALCPDHQTDQDHRYAWDYLHKISEEVKEKKREMGSLHLTDTPVKEGTLHGDLELNLKPILIEAGFGGNDKLKEIMGQYNVILTSSDVTNYSATHVRVIPRKSPTRVEMEYVFEDLRDKGLVVVREGNKFPIYCKNYLWSPLLLIGSVGLEGRFINHWYYDFWVPHRNTGSHRETYLSKMASVFEIEQKAA